jgi:hypothetical protein
LVVLAVLACGWLAHGLRAHDREQEGEAALAQAQRATLSPAQTLKARLALQRAARRNPDRGPDLTEAYLLAALDRSAEAAAIASELTSSEPDNFESWLLTVRTARDRATREIALDQLTKLNPFAGDALRPKPEQQPAPQQP